MIHNDSVFDDKKRIFIYQLAIHDSVMWYKTTMYDN